MHGRSPPWQNEFLSPDYRACGGIKFNIMINKSLQNILAGAANVVDIAPCSDFSRFVPNESAEQRMRSHWERTGTNLRNTLKRYSDEQQTKDQ